MIDRAREEARGLGADYVGTEHLLLALLHTSGTLARDVLVALMRGDGGPGARILRDLGVSAEQLEDAVDEAAAGG